MKTVNQFMPYVYGLLIIVLIGTLIAFFVRLSKTMKKVAETLQGTQGMSEKLEKMNESVVKIQASKESWTFFAAIFAISVIIKETFKYYRSERSLSKSFAKALKRHASVVTKLRF